MTYPLTATLGPIPHTMKGRGITTDEAARVAGGNIRAARIVGLGVGKVMFAGGAPAKPAPKPVPTTNVLNAILFSYDARALRAAFGVVAGSRAQATGSAGPADRPGCSGPALARISTNPVAYGISGFYTSFFRGTPLIVQMRDGSPV